MEENMRAAIMGVGSLGTVLGAYITKAGKQIDLIDAYTEHVDALNKNGARVTGKIEFTVPVKALTPDKMDGTYDLVFFMVKQTYNDAAMRDLKPHVHEKTIIATLQNGLPELPLAETFCPDNIMGCTVGWGATFKGPGVSELTSPTDKMTFDLGKYDGKITPEVFAVKDYLELMCPTEISQNLMSIRMRKLLVNAVMSGMSAILGCTFGGILDSGQALLCAKHIANECLAVSHAAGIKLGPFQGVDFETRFSFSTRAEREATSAAYHEVWDPHRDLTASMLHDLLKGRKCEINAINGAVCTMGDKYSIDTPVNDQIVAIVQSIERGERKPEFKNLDIVKVPELD
jgi:2-dehydropantoate 2-reductase